MKYNKIDLWEAIKHSGAVEAHNPEVGGSKPLSAMYFAQLY